LPDGAETTGLPGSRARRSSAPCFQPAGVRPSRAACSGCPGGLSV